MSILDPRLTGVRPQRITPYPTVAPPEERQPEPSQRFLTNPTGEAAMMPPVGRPAPAAFTGIANPSSMSASPQQRQGGIMGSLGNFTGAFTNRNMIPWLSMAFAPTSQMQMQGMTGGIQYMDEAKRADDQFDFTKQQTAIENRRADEELGLKRQTFQLSAAEKLREATIRTQTAERVAGMILNENGTPKYTPQQVQMLLSDDTGRKILERDLGVGSRGVQVTNVMGDAGGEYLGELMKGATTITEGGRAAVGKLERLNILKEINDRGETGALAPLQGTVASYMAGFGVPPEYIAAAGINPNSGMTMEAFNAISNRLVVDQIGAADGQDGFPANNFSDADREFIRATVPLLGNTPEANALVLEIMRRAEMRKIEAGRSWMQARNEAIRAARAQGVSVDDALVDAYLKWEQDWEQYTQRSSIVDDLRPQIEALAGQGAATPPGVSSIRRIGD